MAGSIHDWERLFRQAFDNLRPDGWLELQDFGVWIYSDDGTLEKAPYIRQWQEKLDEASTKFGKKMNIAHKYKGQMEAAGFVDVVDDVYKVRLPIDACFRPLIRDATANLEAGSLRSLGQGSPAQGDLPIPESGHVGGCRTLHARTFYACFGLEHGRNSGLDRRCQE